MNQIAVHRSLAAFVVLLAHAITLHAEESPLRVSVVVVSETPAIHVESVLANAVDRKVYVGVLSRDKARTGLLVYDMGPDGQPHGEPRRYSDHPDELPPAGQHSTIVCFLHDSKHRKLYFGVRASNARHQRSLVVYSLDEQGEPLGRPRAYDHGNPLKACDALALHPKNNRLYAVGWGGPGFFLLDRDRQGYPVGKAIHHVTGPQGGMAIAIRRDGTKLYRGTYPSILEVCDLNRNGDLVGRPRVHAMTDKVYLRFVATDRALYFLGEDGRLGWYRLDAAGEVIGKAMSGDIPNLQAIAKGATPDCLLVAVGTELVDVINGNTVVDGLEVRELTIGQDGTPGAATRKSAHFERARAIGLSGGAHPSLTARSLGRGFLVNRIAGLHVRCTLVSIETADTPPPTATVVPFGGKRYLRFVVSSPRKRVYGTGDDSLTVHALGGDATAVKHVACTGVTGPVALDERRGVLVAAMKGGEIAVRKLDARGIPADKGSVLKTAVDPIGALAVHPATGTIYAIGHVTGRQTETPGVVPIAVVGLNANDVVLDADRGRLYVVGQYHGRENTSVWKLSADGQLADADPTWVADAIPVDDPALSGMLSGVCLDAKRRKLYTVGAQVNPQGKPAYLVVHDLDVSGDPTGTPRAYPSQNKAGHCQAVALSHDGARLYEAGWGDPRIFLRTLDKDGEPSKESNPWSLGIQGKRQLAMAGDGKYLLVGTYPSQLEVIRMKSSGEPEVGAKAVLSAGPLRKSLGSLVAGRTSDWVDLDQALKDGVGTAVLRCELTGPKIRRAVLRWHVAREQHGKKKNVRTVDVELAGNVGALLVPKYDLDRAADLSSLVRTSAEVYPRYVEIAKKYALKPAERPQRFLVANGLIGIDSSGAALDHGAEVLELLGHNTAQIWNWVGIEPRVIRSTADRHGIRRFRAAIYNPPSYFDYNVDLVQPRSLDQWAARFRQDAAKMGAKPEEIALLHMADEPGWYFPGVTDEVKSEPSRLAVFRDYLKSKGLTPRDVGAASWNDVSPGSPSSATTLPSKRLFFWTTRFYAESLSHAFAAATKSIQRQVSPDVLTTSNLNNWPGRFYIPSPGKKYANNTNTGPDAAMGMPDWFDLGRKQAVTCIWTEDWFGDRDAQLWSLYGDLLRCSAREGGLEYGGYVVGQSTGAFPAGAAYKVMSLVGHGAKAIDPYTFGPYPAFSDGWSEKEAAYRNFATAIRFIGKGERLLLPGRPRDGSVAIVFPQSSQVWDGGSELSAYLKELYGLHAALIHENYPVDFVDDFGIEAGNLSKRKYAAIYVTAPNLSRKSQRTLREWTQAGGTLVLLPGACAFDQYNEPTSELRAVTGAQQADVPRVSPPHFINAYRIERTPVIVNGPDIGVSKSFAISQMVPLKATDGQVIAKFADDSAAAVEMTVGKGRIISFGYWPGVTYWLSPDRSVVARLPIDWSAEARAVATYPARRAKAGRHVIVSEPEVEACLLESKQGLAVTLLNWSGRRLKRITVTIPGPKRYRSVASVQRGSLRVVDRERSLEIALPLDSVDVLLLDR